VKQFKVFDCCGGEGCWDDVAWPMAFAAPPRVPATIAPVVEHDSSMESNVAI
jgi:hypothetical protein